MTEIQIPDASVVVLIGAAGAGKSTFAAKHFPPDAVLSSDQLRAAIAGDAADQSATRRAFTLLHRALDRRLAAGLVTVVDATNVTAPARRTIRRAAARHRVPVIAIVLDFPDEVVLERNAERTERTVPEHVVTRHLEALASTLAGGVLEGEGFAQIIRLRSAEDADRAVVRLVP
ncbi:MAG: metallophosphoesterase [Chloroflexi bacterium]|nr:metallophosphoesterase [Chloroflexota bacterium]